MEKISKESYVSYVSKIWLYIKKMYKESCDQGGSLLVKAGGASGRIA